MSAEIADVLDRAADRIERDGWWQGAYYDGRIASRPVSIELREHPRPCCVMGALIAEAPTRRVTLAEWALKRFLKMPVTLAAWNDAPERSQAEVVAALRGAAAQERGAA